MCWDSSRWCWVVGAKCTMQEQTQRIVSVSQQRVSQWRSRCAWNGPAVNNEQLFKPTWVWFILRPYGAPYGPRLPMLTFISSSKRTLTLAARSTAATAPLGHASPPARSANAPRRLPVSQVMHADLPAHLQECGDLRPDKPPSLSSCQQIAAAKAFAERQSSHATAPRCRTSVERMRAMLSTAIRCPS